MHTPAINTMICADVSDQHAIWAPPRLEATAFIFTPTSPVVNDGSVGHDQANVMRRAREREGDDHGSAFSTALAWRLSNAGLRVTRTCHEWPFAR